MRRSVMFIKTQHQAPADEQARNAQLLIRAGFVHKQMAGVYDYLPLGLLVLNKIIQIIREEMNAIGGEELLLASLQPKENWEKSGRWKDEVIDVWFKTHTHEGQNYHQGVELGLATTHEEPLTAIMRNFVHSYRDLPAYPYQFQTKFRNELRSKSGLLRCREFIMKDLYSFSRGEEEHQKFYEIAKKAYSKIYRRVGLGGNTYLTFASGGSFSKFSHEFQTLTDIGEDVVYVSEEHKLAINKEVYSDEVIQSLNLSKNDLVERKGVEVGNIFPLGTKFSEALGLYYLDEANSQKPVYMGCYGIGPGRLMATIVEHFADEQGLVWPRSVAPFDLYLARLGDSSSVVEAADKRYHQLREAGIKVLYDDRDERAGEILTDSELLGIPYRLVISEKSMQAGGYELKSRTDSRTQIIPPSQVIETLENSL